MGCCDDFSFSFFHLPGDSVSPFLHHLLDVISLLGKYISVVEPCLLLGSRLDCTHGIVLD